MNIFRRKYILSLATFVKAASLVPAFFYKNYWVVLACRLISGFSQVLYTIYFPVWVDQYGTQKEKPVMLAIVGIGVPLGIVFGYLLCIISGKNVNIF
ncbi:MAG: hypothetical protein MJ252_17075 [archaeon]|nr:hypothetical protein [archaeon]